MSTVAFYLLPAVVTGYGLVLLTTGELWGRGPGRFRGPVARLLGALLAATLPLALAVGPPDVEREARERAISRDILDEYQAVEVWRTENEPPVPADLRKLEQIDARARALNEFTAAYARRVAEMEGRVQELQDEQDRHRREREARTGRRQLAVGVAVGLLVIGGLAVWQRGRRR